MPKIVRCVSCEGYGWLDDPFTGESGECDWCRGTGYVYQRPDGVQQPIPDEDYGDVAAELERLEAERLREMGYTGQAKPPWEQDARRGTRGGTHPDDSS